MEAKAVKVPEASFFPGFLLITNHHLNVTSHPIFNVVEKWVQAGDQRIWVSPRFWHQLLTNTIPLVDLVLADYLNQQPDSSLPGIENLGLGIPINNKFVFNFYALSKYLNVRHPFAYLQLISQRFNNSSSFHRDNENKSLIYETITHSLSATANGTFNLSEFYNKVLAVSLLYGTSGRYLPQINKPAISGLGILFGLGFSSNVATYRANSKRLNQACSLDSFIESNKDSLLNKKDLQGRIRYWESCANFKASKHESPSLWSGKITACVDLFISRQMDFMATQRRVIVNNGESDPSFNPVTQLWQKQLVSLNSGFKSDEGQLPITLCPLQRQSITVDLVSKKQLSIFNHASGIGLKQPTSIDFVVATVKKVSADKNVSSQPKSNNLQAASRSMRLIREVSLLTSWKQEVKRTLEQTTHNIREKIDHLAEQQNMQFMRFHHEMQKLADKIPELKAKVDALSRPKQLSPAHALFDYRF